MEEVANPIAKASFDRVEPVVEKMYRRLGFGLRQARRRAIARHGVISAGVPTPESLVGPSWRLRRLQFPTTPATAPGVLFCTDSPGPLSASFPMNELRSKGARNCLLTDRCAGTCLEDRVETLWWQAGRTFWVSEPWRTLFMIGEYSVSMPPTYFSWCPGLPSEPRFYSSEQAYNVPRNA